MPPGPLAHAICAIGYPGDKYTGITSGYSVATLARLSQGQPWQISGRELDRAIRTLAPAGVIKVTHPPAKGGRKQANDYEPDYGYTDTERITEAWDMGRRGRRRERQRRRPTVTTVTIPVDDEAARLAALDDYPEPPELPVVPGCPVCEGTHDPSQYGEFHRFACSICGRHERHVRGYL